MTRILIVSIFLFLLLQCFSRRYQYFPPGTSSGQFTQMVELKDGRSYFGIALQDKGAQVLIKFPDGRDETVQAADIVYKGSFPR